MEEGRGAVTYYLEDWTETDKKEQEDRVTVRDFPYSVVLLF